jgi:hypothetical protein
MNTNTIKKVGRNDKCLCGSDLKFKKCCESKQSSNNKFKICEGTNSVSDSLLYCIEKLKLNFPEHTVLNVSNGLNKSTYTPYQMANMKEKNILIAERNDQNMLVFTTRTDSLDNNIMIMYHGHYRTFPGKSFDSVFESATNMIN